MRSSCMCVLQISNGKVSSSYVDCFSCIALAGVGIEYLKFGQRLVSSYQSDLYHRTRATCIIVPERLVSLYWSELCHRAGSTCVIVPARVVSSYQSDLYHRTRATCIIVLAKASAHGKLHTAPYRDPAEGGMSDVSQLDQLMRGLGFTQKKADDQEEVKESSSDTNEATETRTALAYASVVAVSRSNSPAKDQMYKDQMRHRRHRRVAHCSASQGWFSQVRVGFLTSAKFARNLPDQNSLSTRGYAPKPVLIV
eukprot:154203-Pyramimonas_sp.AAC.1